MIKAKKGKIAPYQLFFVIFVSRLVVSLTYVQTVSVGDLASDLLISLGISFVLTMLISILVILCQQRGKNPFNIKWLGFVYAVYFVYNAALGVCRFSYFATSRMNPDFSMAFFIVVIALCACYGAVMGIEGISRFSALCAVILFLTVACVIAVNIKNMNTVNMLPFIQNTKKNIIMNSIVMSSNSSEIVLFLALSDKVNGDRKKPFLWGITFAYAVIFVLVSGCLLVMGSAANLQAYPIYTLFQLASIGSMSRLDAFHAAFWVLALFMKTAVFIYAASLCTKKFTHTSKCVFVCIATIALSFVISFVMGTSMIDFSKIIGVISFFLCGVVFPVLSLVFMKRKRNDIVGEIL